MAPYAEDYSNRYRVRYTTGRFIHHNLFHYGPDPEVPPAELLAQIASFYDALSAALVNSWEIIGAEYAMAGSNVFIPTAPPVVAVAPAGGTIILPYEANRITFRGKGLGGRTTSLAILGQIFRPDLSVEGYDFRVTRSENPSIDNAIAALNAEGISDPTEISTIDGLAAAWWPDVTIKQDDTMVKRLRGG